MKNTKMTQLLILVSFLIYGGADGTKAYAADDEWSGGDSFNLDSPDGLGTGSEGNAPTGLIVGAQGAFLMPGYKLTSNPATGFGASVPPKPAFGWGVSSRLGYAAGRALQFDFNTFTTTVSTAGTGLSPATDSLTRMSVAVRHDWDFNERWRWGLGIFTRYRNSNTTTPRNLFGHHVAHGAALAAGYERPVGKFRLWAEAEFRLPIFVREFGQTTGSRTLWMEGRGQAGTRFYLGTSKDFGCTFELSASVRYDLEYNRFEGTGSRGTNNATETFYIFSTPIELRILF